MDAYRATGPRPCLKCGASCDREVNFCRQCGASLRLQCDDEVTSVITPPIEASSFSQTSPGPDPEKLWWEGFDVGQKARSLEMEGHIEESQKSMERAMSLWTQALENGVQDKSEVTCHWFLGNEFYDRAIDLEEHYRLSKEPLDQIPTLSKGVTHLERAIELDALIGNFVFGNKENQADLLKLDFVWGPQSMYIKGKYGIESAISYLLNKLRLIQHLRVLLPELFYSLGTHYAEADDVCSAMTMFRAAIKAEDYGDVIDHEDSRYRIAQIAKKNAANNLKYLEIHGKAH